MVNNLMRVTFVLMAMSIMALAAAARPMALESCSLYVCYDQNLVKSYDCIGLCDGATCKSWDRPIGALTERTCNCGSQLADHFCLGIGTFGPGYGGTIACYTYADTCQYPQYCREVANTPVPTECTIACDCYNPNPI